MTPIRTLLAAAFVATAAPALAQSIPSTPEQPGQAETSRVEAGTYQVDPGHTQIVWSVNHLGLTMLEGMFGASEGSLTIDPAAPAEASVDVTFPIASLAVTYEDFAGHLKSADFFDAERYPTVRFVSTSVEPGEGSTARIAGDLTIKDQTKPVTLDVTFMGAGMNPVDNKRHVGFHGTATILRSDFGLGAYAPGVSDEVTLDINADFMAP